MGNTNLHFLGFLLSIGVAFPLQSIDASVNPSDLMHSLQKDETFSKAEWTEKTAEEESGIPIINIVRVDAELQGVIKSTFNDQMQNQLKVGLSATLHLPVKSIRQVRITEWDLSLVVQYVIRIKGAASADAVFNKFEQPSFVREVVDNIMEKHPNLESRFNEIFSNIRFSRPEIIKTFSADEEGGSGQFLVSAMFLMGLGFVGYVGYQGFQGRITSLDYHRIGASKRNRSLQECEDEV